MAQPSKRGLQWLQTSWCRPQDDSHWGRLDPGGAPQYHAPHMNWRRLTPFRIALFVGILLSVLRLAGCVYLERLDVRSIDFRLQNRGEEAPSPDVAIVAIDDPSIAKIGRWPWPRPVIARLIDVLTTGNPAVIGFDIVQSEATANVSTEGLRDRLRGVDEHTWDAIRGALAGGSGDDELLRRSVEASKRDVLGYFYEDAEAPGVPLAPPKPGRAQVDPAKVELSTYNVVQNSKSNRGEQRIAQASMVTTNLPGLTAAAAQTGYFNIFPDLDGTCRRVPLAINFHSRIALPLSLAMLRVYRPEVPFAIRFADYGVESVRWGSLSIPVDEGGQMLVNFRGRGRTFPHISAIDVLDGKVPPATLRGKLVLVGVTATAVSDLRVTPFDSIFPGVEVHANVLDNILRRDFLWQPKWGVLVEIAAILLSVMILGVALHYARGIFGALVAAGLIGAYLVSSQWLFTAYGFPLSLVYPLLAISLTYVAIGVQHYVTEEREKRKIRDAFGLYLNPSLARLVSEKPEMLRLGGDKRELTVLFSDIRGFTTISERLSPEALVELLNQYLGAMTDIVFDHDGTLDKYIGDAIMAVWGAPIPQEDHAARACRAAVDMVTRLRDLNRGWQERGWPPLFIGIGLNTGDMVAGNMGSERRLSYTVMGDNVNLGSRLEGLNKMYGTHIICSDATLREARDVVVARELDLVRVKGKLQPVHIFQILGPSSERERWTSLIERFNAGIAAYRERRWNEGLEIFSAVLAEFPEDGPARLYVERCRKMAAEPPERDWNGVTVMETK